LSLKPANHLFLPDHADYGPKVIERLAALRNMAKAEYLLTTMKDAVKLPADLPLPVLALDTHLEVDRGREFIQTILERLKPDRPHRLERSGG
jgi:tetraacyldisaccharide-1-P 4'-kinase